MNVTNKIAWIVGENEGKFLSLYGDIGVTNLGETKMASDRPVLYRPNRLWFAEKPLVKDQMQVLMNVGMIQESDSDYRSLNALTVKNRSPLPSRISSIGWQENVYRLHWIWHRGINRYHCIVIILTRLRL